MQCYLNASNTSSYDVVSLSNTPSFLEKIERDNRLSAVLQLHTRGLNLEQIAAELDIDQSTVRRDLHLVQQESKNHIEKYMREDILLQYLRYLVGSNEITTSPKGKDMKKMIEITKQLARFAR